MAVIEACLGLRNRRSHVQVMLGAPDFKGLPPGSPFSLWPHGTNMGHPRKNSRQPSWIWMTPPAEFNWFPVFWHLFMD